VRTHVNVLRAFCFYNGFVISATKFVLLTSLAEPSAESVLQKVYETYGDAVMKNPFHTPEMPIRSESFDLRITALIGSGQTS
jgi:trafficking protein particle complex subunit 4